VQQNELLIKNGTMITSHGYMEADLWIRNGKIHRVAKDTLEKFALHSFGNNGLEVIDASDMYLLPGFVTMTPVPLMRLRSAQEYINHVQGLVRDGYTFLLDTLHVEGWMEPAQVLYQKAIHFNNLIDYSVRIGMDAAHFHVDKIRPLCQQGFRLFQLILNTCEDLQLLRWDELSSLQHQYRFSVHLHIPRDARMGAQERDVALQRWMEMCRHAKIRTCIPYGDPLERTEREPFYHVTQVDGERAGRVLEYLADHRYRSLSVVAALTDISVDLRRKSWKAEDLLSYLVRIASTNIAKAIGLYPQKGSFTPGADADILFVKKTDLLTKIDLSTILNLSECHLPTSVMSNGRWIFHEEHFAQTVGMGRCLLDTKPYNYVI
jgi:hypothetical protein